MAPKFLFFPSGDVPENIIPPFISLSGLAAIGSTITTDDGTWTNSPTSYDYEWFIEPSTITGGNSNTLITTSAGWHRSRVTATNSEGSSLPEPSSNRIYIPAPDPVPNNTSWFGGFTEFGIRTTEVIEPPAGDLLFRFSLAGTAPRSGSISGNIYNTTSGGARGHLIGSISGTGSGSFVEARYTIDFSALTESPFISGDLWLNGSNASGSGQVQTSFNGA